MKLIPKRTGYFKSFDDCRIYYEVRGSGKALVFAYGLGCVMNHWQHQIKYFSPNFTTILFDYRGHHKSDTPENKEHLKVENCATDMIELLNYLEIPKASFFGHSFGAPITIEAYSQRPDMFDKMILINGFAKSPLTEMFASTLPYKIFSLMKGLQKSMPDTASFLWNKILGQPISNYAAPILGGFNSRLTHQKDIEIYTRGLSSLDLPAFLLLLEHMTNYDGTKKLKQVQCPTLIIGGAKDPITPISRQKVLHKHIKNSELLIIKEGTHCTQLDKPNILNLKSEQFLLK